MMINEAAPTLALAPRRIEDRGFDLNDLKSRGLGDKLFGWIFANPRWLFALLRSWPLAGFPLFSWVFVTRFDHVQEVLAHDEIFRVPYADKTKELNGGPNFLLGLHDGEEYRHYRKLVMQAFWMEDVPAIVAPIAARMSRQLLERSGGRIDAVEGLLTRVATLICQDYYGLPISDPTEFGHWTIAMSTDIFVDATKVVPAHHRAAKAAAEHVCALVDRAIEEAQRTPGNSNTILARLVALQERNAWLTKEKIRSILIGMVTGFVPTNTLASGRILETLLNRREFMERARAAALASDDDLLRRCLFEALRFKHIHWGLTRIAAQDYTIAAGTLRAKRVRAGKKVLASTWAAMFDWRRVENPGVFDPDRRPADYMLFGYGLHWCVGAYIAQAQITQTFKALLVQEQLRPDEGDDGRLQLLGDFPQHLWMRFRAPHGPRAS
jgi:cytochrome P450